MAKHKIRRGLNIPLAGIPEPRIETGPPPRSMALRTAESIGYKFKVLVEEGQAVKQGEVLCRTRQFPEIVFRSPAGGTVREIRRGARRAVQEIVIEPAEVEETEDFRIWSEKDILSADAGSLKNHLLTSGVWPLIQQRPLAKIARPESEPVAIFINGAATAPLQAKPHVLLQDRAEDFALGVRALSRLTTGNTYLCLHSDDGPIPGADSLSNIETHIFSGPHPSGAAGIHIRKVQPLKHQETAWVVRAEDAADIGFLLRTGRMPTERVVALAGAPVSQPLYLRTRAGADLATLLEERLDDSSPLRYINGDVLTGAQTDVTQHLGIHHSTLTIIPEGTEREFMGWAMPGFSFYTGLRTFASSLLPRRRHNLDTRLHGGHRPIISIGQWDKVFPFDIHLTYLIRAIQAEDVEEAEKLGLLEIAEEDVALCAFIDPSKTEVCDLIRHGLDLYEAENL